VIFGSHESERVYKDFAERDRVEMVTVYKTLDLTLRAHSLEVYGTCSDCR